ncbi:MAG: hypothetical protein ACLSCO_17630 [Gallintestinimicrobium sp.]
MVRSVLQVLLRHSRHLGHCAVLNGIYNACGVRIHEIPALPEKVKAGLDAIAKGEKPYEPKKYFLGSDI